MTSEQTPVTGKEDARNLSTSVRALSEFYQCFNSRDLKKAPENWAQTEEISMDNLLGGRRGYHAADRGGVSGILDA